MISEDPVEATCSLESSHCTPDIAARDFADELDDHDMVGIQIVGENMRGRLAEKHRILALQLSQSSFRYALAHLPSAVLKHVITSAKPPVSWILTQCILRYALARLPSTVLKHGIAWAS